MLDAGDAAEVARAFELDGTAVLAGPVARGVQGRVWRLDAAGSAWAVKEWFPGFAPEPGLGDALRLQDAAVAAGVPTARPRRTPSGEVVAVVRDVPVRAESWLDVGAPTRELDPGLVGSVLARLHALGPGAAASYDLDAWYSAPVGEARWTELVRASEEAGAPFAAQLRDGVPAILDLESCWAPPRQLQTCHRDLWPDNVLPSPTTGLAVIDWENSGPADPAQELMMVLFGFGADDLGRAAAIAEAYRRAGGPARLVGRGDATMTGAVLGHILEMHVEDWLAARSAPGVASSEPLARAEAGVREVLDEPLTVAVVDELVALGR